MTLEETIQFIEAKETGKASASHLSNLHTTGAVRSTYKRSTNQIQPINRPHRGEKQEVIKNYTCSNCGKTDHSVKGKTMQDRKALCPAFGHTCTKCNKPNHWEKVCRSKQKSHASALNTYNTYYEDSSDEDLLVIQNDPSTATYMKCGTIYQK